MLLSSTNILITILYVKYSYIYKYDADYTQQIQITKFCLYLNFVILILSSILNINRYHYILQIFNIISTLN